MVGASEWFGTTAYERTITMNTKLLPVVAAALLSTVAAHAQDRTPKAAVAKAANAASVAPVAKPESTAQPSLSYSTHDGVAATASPEPWYLVGGAGDR